MHKKIIFSLIGISIIPLIAFYLYISTHINSKSNEEETMKVSETIKNTKKELLTEIVLKNAKYVENLFKKIESDISVLKFQTDVLTNKKDKNFDYIDGLAKRVLMTNNIAARVFVLTNSFYRTYHIIDASNISDEEKENFLKTVDDKNNISKKIIWSGIYNDTKNNNLISCLMPLYRQNKLEGVIGIEINISKSVNKIINKDFKYKDSYAFVINKDSIINSSVKAEDIFGDIRNKIIKTKNGIISTRGTKGVNRTIFFAEIYPVKWIFCISFNDNEIYSANYGFLNKDINGNSPASAINKSSLLLVFFAIFVLTITAGFLISKNLVLAAKALGYKVIWKQNWTADKVKKIILGGQPVICNFQFAPKYGEGHYAVIIGFTKSGEFILADPAFDEGFRKIKINKFMKQWYELEDDTRREGIVIFK